MVRQTTALPTIGWREWVSLPRLGVEQIKVKVDTGARTSSLHAFNLEYYRRSGQIYVHFAIHPFQRDDSEIIETSARLLEKRRVRDSGGKTTLRPVICTPLRIGSLTWEIELTLINRSEMGFRMLLGRQAVRNQLLINPGKSYLLGKKGVRK
ncbi:MAG: ATP-dependent zinc protease [Deltaproteobacteria bacterium]|nr:ATP-dependent zinc protease [Deltaproteobacteria bacterium]